MLEKALGYAGCALVLADPEGWIDVSSVTDVAEIAAEFRRKGRDLRVASKYPNLSRRVPLRQRHQLLHHRRVERCA